MNLSRQTDQNNSIKKDRLIQDLALAAFLVAIGNPLIRSPAKENMGRKFIFAFEDTPKLERDILDFYNRTARVDPLSFSEVFRNLKALTF